jgi:transcriptional regulator with XRE-family HTH domain
MRKDAQTRIRLRIRARLEELGMTARELARAVRHDVSDREVDAWISGILKGRQGLHWKHFDAVADKLGLSPSELVRYEDAELRELTPSEMRLLLHYRDWPEGIRDRWLDMLDHFSATVPDRDTAILLDRLRRTPRGLRKPVTGWLLHLLEEGIPPAAVTGGVEGVRAEGTAEPDTTRRGRLVQKSSAFQSPRAADQRAPVGPRRAADPPPPKTRP